LESTFIKSAINMIECCLEGSVLREKFIAVSLIGLIFISTFFLPIDLISGQSFGVSIFQITPEDLTGIVGQKVNLQGSIFTSNGTFQVYLGRNLVATNKADGYYVNSSFIIPELPKGNHQITLRDSTINVNATQLFEVKTGYSIKAILSAPTHVQEGSNVILNITVTGAQVGTSINAEIAVVIPSPLSIRFSRIVALGYPNQKGTAQAQITFPDSSFQPEGSTTDYAGKYIVYFNHSESLASNQFIVSFIDSIEYHRGQVMTIRATGYQPNTDATLSVSGPKGIIHSETVTASATGVISTTWVVSSEAVVGEHTVKITPQGTQKAIQDSQSFHVTGYPVKIRTTDLSGQVVSQVRVEALDTTTDSIFNGTSGSDGIANLRLEKGNHILSAFWNRVKVGQTNITVTGEGTFDLQCHLASLKVTVKDTNGMLMPFVDLEFYYRYSTSSGASEIGTALGKTDPLGIFILDSALTGVDYTINASMYNQVFNLGNNTISSLPNQAFSEVTIICPSRKLSIEVVDYNRKKIANARLELVELTNGLFYADITDNSGIITNNVTFGMYRARIYKDAALINETMIEAFDENKQQIRCLLYGLQLSISVVDFFGQVIPNANVTLNGPGTLRLSAMTHRDGAATFTNIIGGNMQIVVFASENEETYQALNVRIQNSTSMRIRLDKYVVLGPGLITVSSLLTGVIVLLVLITFLLIEFYRWRKMLSSHEK
jgi:hypothetical protein